MNHTRVVLITGATAGIGQVTAALMAAHGFRVFGTGRHPEPSSLEEVELLPLDVTDPESVAACVRTVLDRAGRLDVLINNAGSGLVGPLEETTEAQAQALFAVNFFGAHRLVRAALPALRASDAGLIVNVGSAAGLVGVPYEGMYCATKFALEGYSESLRLELRPFGVRVVLVEPGVITTRFMHVVARTEPHLEAYRPQLAYLEQLFARPRPTAAPPEAVARVILRAALRPRPALRYRVGKDAKLAAFVKRWLPPSWLEAGIAKAFRLPWGR